MDIGQNFTLSFNELMKKKVLVAPALLSSLISTILILIFIFSTGLNDVGEEYTQFVEKYEKENPGKKADTNNPEFSSYLESNGWYDNIFDDVFTKTGIIFIVIIVIVIAATSYYLSCASLALITLNINKKKLSIKNTISLTNKFLWKYFLLYFFTSLLIMAIVVIAALLIAVSFIVNKIIGVLSTVFIVLGGIALLVFLLTRLFFGMPIMFMEDKGAMFSLKHSYKITKNHWMEIFLLVLVIVGISMTFGFLSNAFFGSIMELLTSNALKIMFTMTILLLFYVINSFVTVFIYMFLFYSYINFKKTNKIVIKN